MYIYGVASMGCVGNSAAGSLMSPSKISGVGWIWSCILKEVDMKLGAGKRGKALFWQR